MSSDDEYPDDYFGAVAEVVEAARSLDEAKRKEAETGEAHLQAHTEMRKAEGVLRDALDKLKGADVQRGGGDS